MSRKTMKKRIWGQQMGQSQLYAGEQSSLGLRLIQSICVVDKHQTDFRKRIPSILQIYCYFVLAFVLIPVINDTKKECSRISSPSVHHRYRDSNLFTSYTSFHVHLLRFTNVYRLIDAVLIVYRLIDAALIGFFS